LFLNRTVVVHTVVVTMHTTAAALVLCMAMAATAQSDFYSFTAVDIDGNERSMSEWKGYVVIVSNVASF